MDLQIREQTVADLEDYAQVPMVLTVGLRYRTELIDGGLGGWSLIEETVDPYRKDIDEIDPATSWLQLDGVSNWSVFAAYDGQDRVGGAGPRWRGSCGLEQPDAPYVRGQNGLGRTVGPQGPLRVPQVGSRLQAI